MNKEIKKMAAEVGHDDGTFVPGKFADAATVPAELLRSQIQNAEDIMRVQRIDIPKCMIQPTNGRIYLVEISGTEKKTASGLILPYRMRMRKDDSTKEIMRYFVVDWDKSPDLPQHIQDQLRVGIEVNPFLPEEALEWDLPKVIDWNTGYEFKCVHYTELAGICKIVPVEVEK